MLGLVSRNWWVFAIRGIAAIVFGILAFLWPEATLTVLVILFGAYVLVDGVALLVALVGCAFSERLGASRLAVFAMVLAAAASHGILDAMTTGGLGVAFFSELCGRTSLYSTRHSSIIFFASVRSLNQFRFRHSSRNLPLKLSM